MGIFGREVATSLAARGYSVLAIDADTEIIESVKDAVAQALVLDTTDEHALLEAKIDQLSIVVNAIGTQHIENSILTTALLRQLEVPRIIARATNGLHERILRQVGATEVVNPEQDMGRRVAYQIARPGLREVLSLAEDIVVAEVPVPASFVGKTLNELDVRRKYGVNVVGVQRVKLTGDVQGRPPESRGQRDAGHLLDQKRRMILNVAPDSDTFLADDQLVVIGREADVDRLSGLG
jgi:trk system potassium uptake protein TrkA